MNAQNGSGSERGMGLAGRDQSTEQETIFQEQLEQRVCQVEGGEVGRSPELLFSKLMNLVFILNSVALKSVDEF